MGLGPQNLTKKLTQLVDLSGHLLSRNHVSNFSDLGPPLLNGKLFRGTYFPKLFQSHLKSHFSLQLFEDLYRILTSFAGGG